MAGQPSLSDVKAEILFYDEVKNHIQKITTSIIVGSIEMITGICINGYSI